MAEAVGVGATASGLGISTLLHKPLQNKGLCRFLDTSCEKVACRNAPKMQNNLSGAEVLISHENYRAVLRTAGRAFRRVIRTMCTTRFRQDK